MSLFIMALALSVDAFAVGAAFGLRGIRLGIVAKTVIAALSALFAFVAVTLGSLLGAILPASAGKNLGACVLLTLGIMTSLRAVHPKKPPVSHSSPALGGTILVLREPSAGDLDHSGAIELGEAFILGLSLSVDMLGAGIGLALAGISRFYLPFAVGVTQTLCLAAGELLGKQLFQLPIPKQVISFLSGVILAGLGIVKFLT